MLLTPILMRLTQETLVAVAAVAIQAVLSDPQVKTVPNARALMCSCDRCSG